MSVLKKREAWIDGSKTILIFLMVLGHNNLPGCERTWIYGFHMSAFFMLTTKLPNKQMSIIYSTGTLFILGIHKIFINIFEIWGRYLSNTTLSSLVYTVLVMIMCYYPIKWSMKKAPWLLGK